MTYKENELYQEIELIDDGAKIGTAEIDLKNKMLSRLSIFEPYQNKGYGTKIVAELTEKYGLDTLWVNASNERAIHVYEKNGYKKIEPTMFLMKKESSITSGAKIKALPSVQPKAEQKSKTGHWIEQIDHEENCRTLICSNCNRPALHDENSIWASKFCPNCGARMSEVSE